jgi:anaerobic magnesium-protoporphyrin IX monomethyl ester cyclase
MKVLVMNIALRANPARIFLPIGLGYVLTAMKRAGFDCEVLDLDAHPQPPEETERFLRTHRYDVVAMGCIVTGYRYVKWLVETVKNAFPQTVVIVGNTVASSIPEILLGRTRADIAVMGEGDETIVELLQRLETSRGLDGIRGIRYRRSGQVVANPPRPPIANLDALPFPDWDLLDVEAYIRSLSRNPDEPRPPIPPDEIRAMPVNTARGCPFQCTFCYHAFREVKYRCRSAASVIAEVRERHQRYGINLFAFNDELTFYSVRQAEEFAGAMTASGLQVWWNADVRSGLFHKDEHVEVARKLRRAGCLALGYSLESADPGILKAMKKGADAAAFLRQAHILQQAGIAPLTSIVLGYPTETPETIRATIDCCITAGIYPSAGYLLPQPGTPMYDYARARGFIRDEEEYLLAMGDRQDLRLNLTHMPDDEFEAVVGAELARCSRALGLELSGQRLLKTSFYRSTKGGEPCPPVTSATAAVA